jgi:hypothetical protein
MYTDQYRFLFDCLEQLAVWVQNTTLTLPYFIEVFVPRQRKMNDHVCVGCAYRFCLHFYVLLIDI